MGVSMAAYALYYSLIVQTFPFRCSSLARAIELIKKVDGQLKLFLDVSCHVTRRIYIGIALVLFLVNPFFYTYSSFSNKIHV